MPIGVTPIQNNISNALQIGNATLPPEGPKAIPYNFNFQTANTYLIDINFLYQNKIISVIQTFYCDNSANSQKVTVNVQQTNQNVTVPPGAQGYFSVLCPSGGTMTVSSGGAFQVPFYLINVPISTEFWYPGQGAQAFNFDAQGNLKTADQLLAAITQNLGGGNALDVNVVHTTAAGGNLINTYNFQNNYTGGTQQLLAATAGKTWTINSIYIFAYASAYQASGAEQFYNVQDSGSNKIYNMSFFLPNALPAGGASRIQPQPLLQVENQALSLGVNNGLFLAGGSGFSGTFGLSCTVTANLT